MGLLVTSVALSIASSAALSIRALRSRMRVEARLGVVIVDVGVVASAAVSSPFPLVWSSALTERRSSSSVVLQCMTFLSEGMVTILLAVASLMSKMTGKAQAPWPTRPPTVTEALL